MTDGGSAGAVTVSEDRARRRRQLTVLVGVTLTIVGVLAIAGTLPIAPGPLAHQLPLTGGGIFAAWLGGVLMGRSSGAAPPRRARGP